MTTQAIARRRRPRGQHPKRLDQELQPKPLPQYLEAHEVQAIIRAADDPRARLLMTEQWRAGLRVSEALALEVADLSLDAELPTIRVRSGKGRKSRIVPVHPELRAAFSMALAYGNVSEGRIIDVHRTTAWRWVQKAVERAEQLGAIPLPRGRHSHVSTQLCPTPAYERHPHQLSESVVGALVNPDDAHLPGACARPDWESGDGAVNLRPIQSDVTNCPTESLVRCNAGPRSHTVSNVRAGSTAQSLGQMPAQVEPAPNPHPSIRESRGPV